MSYEIRVKKNVAKKLRSIPRSYVPRIYLVFQQLSENPRPSGSKKLKGDVDAYRVRVGVYRVVYTIDDDIQIVEITRLFHRQDGY